MLNRDERRQLAEIERQLRREDPGLAHRLTRGPGGRRCARWAITLMAALSVLCVLLGLLVSVGTVVFAGLVLLGVALWIAHTRPRTEDDHH
jgi:Flp pilus assembly protein TadB